MKLKKLRTRLLVLAAVLVCTVCTALYAVRDAAKTDDTPPVIRFEQEHLELSVHAAADQLLQGASAQDDRDGDVTGSLVVEGYSPISADHTVTVTYAAFDRAGNVTKATRTVRFTDYTAPRFGLDQPLMFRADTSPDLLRCLTAEDQLDGDISGRIKGTLVASDSNLNQPGVHEVEFRVTNSMGDTTHLTLPVEIYSASDYNATATLTEYLVYLNTGDEFNPEAYLDKLTAGGVDYPLTEPVKELRYIISVNRYRNPKNFEASVINLTIESNVDTTVPGVYSVCYTVDLNERYLARTRLNVVVEG